MDREARNPPHTSPQDGKRPTQQTSLNDNNTETRSATSQPADKNVLPFQLGEDVDEARQNAMTMESVNESKASDEGSSPPVMEEQPPPRPAGPPAPPPPVDGGLLCWLQVVGAFGIWMNSWGLVNSFGVFQTFYEIDLLGGTSPSNISWIGSIQAFLLLFLGALSGPAFDAGYFKHLVAGGNLFIVFGLMMTSICKEYWQFVLAQGIVCGIGFGMLFAPAVAIVPQYFVKKRAIAGGIAAAGSGLGGVIFPIMLHRLERQIGFGWAVRIIAFIVLLVGLISTFTMQNKLPAGKVRKLYDPTFFRNPPILWYTAGIFFVMMALYIPIYYIGLYAIDLGITGPNLAFYLLSILMASSIVGRILPNFFADKTGMVNMLVPTCFATGILGLAWIAVKDKAGLIVLAILYGSCSGLILTLMPTGFPSFVKDVKLIGTNLGMAFMIDSIGVLVGTPISGAILRHTGDFTGLQAFAGASLVVAGILIGMARIAKVGVGLTKI